MEKNNKLQRVIRAYRTRRVDEKLQDIIETRERTFEYTFEGPFFYHYRLLCRPSLESLYEGTFLQVL